MYIYMYIYMCVYVCMYVHMYNSAPPLLIKINRSYKLILKSWKIPIKVSSIENWLSKIFNVSHNVAPPLPAAHLPSHVEPLLALAASSHRDPLPPALPGSAPLSSSASAPLLPVPAPWPARAFRTQI